MKHTANHFLKTALLGLLVFSVGCSKVLHGGDPEPACTFVQNRDQQRVSWKTDLPIQFRVHEDLPNEARESLMAAAMKWNLISSKNVIEFIDWDFKGTSAKGYADNRPTIFWETTWEEDRSSEQARTTVVWTGAKIRDADIKINAQDFKFSYLEESFDFRKVDFVSLLVHEMGHALGFAHSETRKSVMFPFLSKGADRRRIRELSDLESYSCEYGDEIVRAEVLAAAIKGEDIPLGAVNTNEDEGENEDDVATAAEDQETNASSFRFGL